MSPRARASLLFACALAGCDFTSFGAYRQDTPTLSFPTPDDYHFYSFGSAVASVSDESTHDWLVLSGGLGTPAVALQVRDGVHLLANEPTTYLCGGPVRCNNTTNVGVALGGIAHWGDARACAITGAFGTLHELHLACLGNTPARTFDIAPPNGFEQSGFGLAFAAPPHRRASDPPSSDVLFVGIGAHQNLPDTGRVFAAQPNTVTDITPHGLPTGASLGASVAVGYLRIGAGTSPDFIVAVGAPEMRGVVVLRGEPRAGRPMQPVGCIVRPDEPGFGGAVAVGDVDGDGDDDVIAAASGDANGRMSRVHVFGGSAAPGGLGCDASRWPELATGECADVNARGVRCGASFGETLAAGDLDADGRDEVLVGAEDAEVDGVMDAGAVWVMRAQSNGTGGTTLAVASVLRNGMPSDSDRLGSALSIAHIGARDEVLAGAPGATRAVLFLCSGIPGDSPHQGDLDGQCR